MAHEIEFKVPEVFTIASRYVLLLLLLLWLHYGTKGHFFCCYFSTVCTFTASSTHSTVFELNCGARPVQLSNGSEMFLFYNLISGQMTRPQQNRTTAPGGGGLLSLITETETVSALMATAISMSWFGIRFLGSLTQFLDVHRRWKKFRICDFVFSLVPLLISFRLIRVQMSLFNFIAMERGC